MKRFLAVVLVLLGVLTVLFGLLFLLGAAGQVHRYVVATIGLLAGAGLVAVGGGLYRRAGALRPEHLKAEVLALASRRSGEVSEADLRAGLGGRWRYAQPVLDGMVAEGSCTRSIVDGILMYAFPGLLPRLVVRRCEFCQAELPLERELTSCPVCGGTIRTGVEQVSLSGGDHYDMDE